MIDEKIIERLYSRRRFGIKLGLEVVHGMLAELDNPQNQYGIVHVAGTNGKGSVCAILESVFRAAGYKTGLYTSPHLVSLNERFKVGMIDVDDASLSALIDDVEQCALSVEKSEGRAPTFFECTTVMAFEHFRRAGVDLAVIETGLGGRYDATNVVLPLLSVITRISMEHTEHLGDNIVSIAHEKAGIIKRGRPVVCGAMDDDARGEIRRVAEENGSGFRLVEEMVNVTVKETDIAGQKVVMESQGGWRGTFRFPLIGAHLAFVTKSLCQWQLFGLA
jgi:dihydrofolate synthase/folylpolyglutamate synthase